MDGYRIMWVTAAVGIFVIAFFGTAMIEGLKGFRVQRRMKGEMRYAAWCCMAGLILATLVQGMALYFEYRS